MGSKTVMMGTKPEIAGDDHTPGKPTATLGIQSDTAFSEATKRLCGRDLCSIADLTVQEMAAVMELAHAVKNHPEDFRHFPQLNNIKPFRQRFGLINGEHRDEERRLLFAEEPPTSFRAIT